MLSISHLLLNNVVFLMGVKDLPIISWKIKSAKKNTHQVSYQLQIGVNMEFHHTIFDSGWVTSNESVNITFPNIRLTDSTRYYLRVRINDNYARQSDWSPTASLVTGIAFSATRAEFISGESDLDSARSHSTLLRKEFTTSNTRSVVTAYAHASALGLYRLRINGEEIGNDVLKPGWSSYHHHLIYQTFDVTAQIKKGKNTIGAIVGPGWYKGDFGYKRARNYYGNQTAFIVAIDITYDDGSTERFVSDASWKSSDGPLLFSEIYDGEIYDARREQEGWDDCEFDDRTWRRASIVNYEKNALYPQGTCTLQIQETITPKNIFTTPAGDTVIDFGQNFSGWVEFDVVGNAGEKVTLTHFESLDACGNVYIDNLRTAKQSIAYILKGGEHESYEPSFTYQGFRYVRIDDYPGKITAEKFRGKVIHSALEMTGRFACSNQDLNQLHHNILWGLKSNFFDVPTDCPQRDERLGWTGDAQIFARTASYLTFTGNFFAKWLRDLAYDQTEDGGVPHVIPDVMSLHPNADVAFPHGTHSASAWADAAIIVPWTLFMMYGDKAILKRQYVSMKSWIDFMTRHANNHHWGYKRQFGDWVALDAEQGSYYGATPNELTCMAYYAYSTLLMSKIAKVLGFINDSVFYGQLHQDIKTTYQNTFFNKDGRMTVMTQTAHIISLYFDLVPCACRDQTVDALVSLLKKHDGHLVTGFIGTPYFCHALSQNGRIAEAWDLLLKDDFPSWLYQVKAGATTVWEHWDGLKPDGTMWSAEMNSFNHYAYGAVGDWLYRSAAGLEIDEKAPGFRHAIIQPNPGGQLTWLEAAYESVYGPITVCWRVCKNIGDHNIINLNVSIPPNTTASVILNDVLALRDAGEVAFTTLDKSMTAEIGSGEYQFSYEVDMA